MLRRFMFPRAIIPTAAALLLAACADAPSPTAAPSPDLNLVRPYTVVVTPGRPTLAPGHQQQLAATLLSPTGQPVSGATFRFTSGDPTVATTTREGLVTAVKPGELRITATATSVRAGVYGQATVTVAEPEPCSVSTPNTHAPAPTTVKPVGAEDDSVVMIRLTATDEDLPCDAFHFDLTLVPGAGRLYQVSADGHIEGERLTLPESRTIRVTNPDGYLAYVPNANVFGTPISAFTYVITDAAGNRSGTVVLEIDITPVNDTPFANPSTHTGFNVEPITDVTLDAQDVETAQALAVCIRELPTEGDLYWGFAAPENLVRAGDCRGTTSLEYVTRFEALGCAVVPASAYPRNDTFTWDAFDGEARSTAARDVVSVVYANDAPVYTGPRTLSAQEDGSGQITLTGSDPDGDPTRFVITALPAHGTLYVGGVAITAPFTIPSILGPTPQITYVPNPNFDTMSQSEQFTLRVRDAHWRDCDYPVQVDVAPVNDAPAVTGPATLSASRAADGTPVPAQTSDIRIADDARATDVLTVTLRAQGPAAGGVDLLNASGLTSVQRVSATELRITGTLAALNAALGRGVAWTPGAGGEAGELVVTADDGGAYGVTATGPLTGTLTIAVSVSSDVDLLSPED